eukprot:COSAG04_NODE_2335_length_4307_cov_3.183416_2_plen_91_part_00
MTPLPPASQPTANPSTPPTPPPPSPPPHTHSSYPTPAQPAHGRKTRLRPWVVQVCVPQDLAEELGRVGHHHAEWEEFSKENLMRGGDLRR